nr:MAG TPA: hypothetical protein [Caudoviricetes sp.]
MQIEIEKILVDIITHELDLPENYGQTAQGDVIPCVTIYAQNIKLFNTDKLQITVKTLTAHDYSNRIEYIQDPENPEQLLEVQNINQGRMMQVDVYSRNNEARQRFWEVSAALKSTYATQMQDLYSFKIGTITNDINLSGLGGGSDVNRYTVTFNVIVHYQKSKPVDYYDKFQSNIDNERGQFAQINIPKEIN